MAAAVAILIVSYNDRACLAECLESIEASGDTVEKRVVVVDNASSDDSVAYVREHHPEVEVIEAGENLGFAGGNNRGWAHIAGAHPAIPYVCLLNQDTVVAPGWLEPLVEMLEAEPTVGCVQPKIVLHPETDRLNTAGNVSHYLGFGFTTGYREKDDGRFDTSRSIDYASGAALVVRASILRETELFDPSLWMYLEDAELGWKVRQLGYDIRYVPTSRVAHKYVFKVVDEYYYELERNRWWLLLTYYRLPTLLVLTPALTMMEIGQLVFAASRRRLPDKLTAYGFFWKRENWRTLRERRRLVQGRRVIGDGRFMTRFSGSIDTPELDTWVIRWIANPIFGLYWQVVKRLIFW